jgi:aryl-alcohol dehydrogenase-like predicted oxidoreductase
MINSADFARTRLDRLDRNVCRLGLSASYRPGRKAVERALAEGVDYCFLFGFDGQMIDVLSHLSATERERLVIATGAYNYIWTRQNFRRTLEKRLRQLRTSYIDAFHFLGVMKPEQLPENTMEELQRLRDSGHVRSIAISVHDRRFAGQLARCNALDGLMIRYNAAHRGAETDIFPCLASPRPMMIGYTATRWTRLLRRPRGWKGDVPTPSQCYRFVLSHPAIDVCLTAPRSERELLENLNALTQGPISDEERDFLSRFGDVVHERAGWFM